MTTMYYYYLQDGLVYLSVNHPLPVSPDINSTPSSFSPDDISQLLLQDVTSEGDMLSGSDKEKEDDEEKDLDKKRTLTPVSFMNVHTLLKLNTCVHVHVVEFLIFFHFHSFLILSCLHITKCLASNYDIYM